MHMTESTKSMHSSIPIYQFYREREKKMNNKLKLFVVPVLALSTISLVGCGDKSTGLDEAADYLKAMYEDKSASTTASYDLVSKVVIDETTYSIAWSVSIDEGGLTDAVKVGTNDGTYTKIDVRYDAVYNASARTDYDLIATISNPKGKTTTVSFERYVPQFIYTSLTDFLAADDDTDVNVKGRVIMRSNWTTAYTTFNVWLQNEEGGYYAYRLPVDSEEKYNTDLAIGNEIVVSGKKDTYSGQLEIANPTYQVISTTSAEVAYVDATTDFTNASSNKDTASLNKYQNMKIELKDVEITGVTDNSSGNYYNFKLGNNVYYLRGSKSYGLTDDDLTALFSEWVPGYKATVRGVCQVYSSAFYFQPISASDVTITSKTLTDDVKVDGALEETADLFAASYLEATSIDLPANASGENYTAVSYTWALNAESDTTCFAIADGKLNISVPSVPGTTVTGKVDVTATLNDVSKTVTYTMTVTNPLEVSSYTYSFATASTLTGTELNETSALALFNSAYAGVEGSNQLSSVAVSKVYDGNGTGGAYPNSSGFLKFGTGSAAGVLTLTLPESVKISKVVVNCHDWYKMNESNPTNSNTVSVNGSETQLAPYNTEGTPGDLTFEIEASNEITITSGNRIFVFSITLFVAE